MRGTNSNQVLVLIDGVRVNSATTGSTALEHIMLDSIERIEVVRGNVSSLYGSEAIGGVIQLFTKHGAGTPAPNASAGVGSRGTLRLAAGFSGTVNDTSFSINAGRVRTDGVSAINPRLMPGTNPNNNGYDNNSFNAQVKHVLSADHLLSASLFTTRSDTSFDNPYNFAVADVNNTVENIGKISVASDDQISEMWHSQVRLAQGVDDSHTYLNGSPDFASGYHNRTQSNQTAWQNNLKIADGQQLSLSAEHLGQSITSDTQYTQIRRNVNSILGGYTGEYGVQQVQLNLRQDRYSDFGIANSGLLGYSLAFSGSWRATASISNAFKAPTFNDMYKSVPSWGYLGNPNLKPERSRNKEAGLHYAGNGQRIDMVYFDNRVSDLIAFNAGFTSMINVNQAQITGQEYSYAGDFGSGHLKANATFQNPRDSGTGQPLLRRAKEFGSVAATHDLAAWNIGGEVRYSGTRKDVDWNGNLVTLPGYSLFNLTSNYNIGKHLSVTARVDNLFNRNYSEVYSYNTLGRTLFVGLSYR
jgi:vitamin B12 transporter